MANVSFPVPILFTHYGEEWIRGSERCLLNLLSQLDRSRFKPVVWCNSQVMVNAVKALDVPVFHSQFPLLFGWQRPRLALGRFSKLVKQGIKLVEQFDIKLIHANSGAPNQWLNLVARSRGLPLLTHLHACYQLRDRYTLGLHQVAMAVGVSRAVIQPLLDDGMDPAATRVIPNGLDIEQLEQQPISNLRPMLGICKKDFVIAATGFLVDHKGIDQVIQATAQVVTAGIPAQLIIIGTGPDRDALQEQARNLGIWSRTHFLGERSDVLGLLRGGVDLFMSGARMEAFGLALAEASLAKLAVVAPNVGGIPEVVIDEKSGLLVPPNNPEALAQAATRLYQQPEQRQAMGESGCQYIREHFDIHHNAAAFSQLYEELLQNPAMQMRWRSHWQLRKPLQQGGRHLARLTRRKARKESAHG